jgi:hypothetical protein
MLLRLGGEQTQWHGGEYGVIPIPAEYQWTEIQTDMTQRHLYVYLRRALRVRLTEQGFPPS